MTNTKTVRGLERNPWKAIVRKDTIDTVKCETKENESPFGVGMPGRSGLWENGVVKAIPNCKIVCIENNKTTARIAKARLSKKCSLIVGDWIESINSIKKKIDFAWFDSCNIPSLEAVNTCVDDINNLNPSVYMATFDLSCRRLENGGSEGIKKELLGHEAGKTLNRNTSGKTSFGVIQAVCRYVAKTTGYAPATVFFYGGGKNKKNPSVPMVTIVYCLRKEYEATRFSWKNPCGFNVSNFVDLFNVKNGITTLEQELQN